MQIRVKLMGVLKTKTPAGGTLDIAESATIETVLGVLGIASDSVQVFTVNGQIERNRQRPLVTNDDLAILPPVGGG